MNIFLNTCICVALFTGFLHLEAVEYSTRIQNITVYSETDSAYLVNFSIFRTYTEYRASVVFNITKDVNVKNIQIIINRCNYEKLACEYFVRWTFPRNNMKAVLFMKNQMWTPAFSNFKPRFDCPLLRKGVYENDDLKFDGKAVIAFYPDAMDYYFLIEANIFDMDNKKAIITNMDTYVHAAIKRDVKRNFRNSTRKSTPRTLVS